MSRRNGLGCNDGRLTTTSCGRGIIGNAEFGDPYTPGDQPGARCPVSSRSSTLNTRPATSSMRKRRACASARSLSCRARSGSLSTCDRRCPSSLASVTLKNSPAPPATSSCAALFPTTIGAPQCIASRTGSASSSYDVSETNAAHRWYRSRRASAASRSVSTNRSATPCSAAHWLARFLAWLDRS